MCDAEGKTVEAEGIFIKPAWARGRWMKFYVSTAFSETEEAVEIAKAADDLGYDGVGIPTTSSTWRRCRRPYPTRGREAPVGGIHAVARPVGACRCDGAGDDGLKFVHDGATSRRCAIRIRGESDWTAAYLADGALSWASAWVGVKKSSTLMGQRFDRRGKRTDEILELFRALWAPGWTEFAGSSIRRRGWRWSRRRRGFRSMSVD
jgi:hypothetical protein